MKVLFILSPNQWLNLNKMFLGLKEHAISVKVVNPLKMWKKENQKKDCQCIILNIQISFNLWAFQYTTQEFCQSKKENKSVGEWGRGHEISVLLK